MPFLQLLDLIYWGSGAKVGEKVKNGSGTKVGEKVKN